MSILLLALTVASARAEKLLLPTAHGAKPVGNPGDWVTTEDYPKAAVRDRATGRTGFVLSIDDTGQVIDCNVTESSDNNALDAAACATLRFRAHFVPATDRRGKAIASTYRSAVVWKLPDGGLSPLRNSDLRYTYEVDDMGNVVNCAMTGSGIGDDPRKLCRLMEANMRFEPIAAADGRPQRRRVSTRVITEVSDIPDPPAASVKAAPFPASRPAGS